jgi:hypothetical protein
MRRAMVILAAVILTIGLAVPGFTQDCKIPVFAGTPGAVDLGSWGSGNIEVDEEESFLEGEALKVETTGFFAGGRLQLKQPLEASRFLADPEGGYLKLVVKIHEPAPAQPLMPEGGMFPGEDGMFPGDMPWDPEMFPGGWPPEGMAPGRFPPGVDPGMEPWMDPGMMEPGMEPGMEPWWDEGMEGMEGVMAPPAPPKKITMIRALIVTDLGAIDSGAIEVAEYPEIVEDWVQIVLPLSAFDGPADIREGTIQHIALFGNVEETFWVGDVTLGYEEQPLIADAGGNRSARANAPTQFEAAPQAEGVSASYVWDFDDLDGIQEEGFGRETTWSFPEAGYYVVTLTVSDPGRQEG